MRGRNFYGVAVDQSWAGIPGRLGLFPVLGTVQAALFQAEVDRVQFLILARISHQLS